MTVRSLVAVVVTAALSWIAALPAPAGRGCPGPAYRQFDFFAGDWDTYEVGRPDSLVARNHVTPMLDGCALREVYEQNDGLRGESFSVWDRSRGIWHQSWVTNSGTLLLLDGGLHGDTMTLTAKEGHPDGHVSLLRGIWWPEGTTVREKAERSPDGGATWTPVFDLVFRPHGAPSR